MSAQHLSVLAKVAGLHALGSYVLLRLLDVLLHAPFDRSHLTCEADPMPVSYRSVDLERLRFCLLFMKRS